MKKYLVMLLVLSSCVANQPIRRREPIDPGRGKIDQAPSVMIAQEMVKSSVAKPHCGEDMVFIHGNYCPNVEEHCVKWMDNSNLPYARCAKYTPSTCKSDRVHKEYCIDKYEFHDETGLPIGNKSWTQCKQICDEQSRRLCNNDEWTFAASGEDMHPYAYGDGYTFDNATCNIERRPLVCSGTLCDHRENINNFPGCISPFGVKDMIGSEDEWIEVPLYSVPSVKGSMRSALKGGHYLGGRHRTQPMTKGHNESHYQLTTGCRCCSDSK